MVATSYAAIESGGSEHLGKRVVDTKGGGKEEFRKKLDRFSRALAGTNDPPPPGPLPDGTKSIGGRTGIFCRGGF